MDGAKAATDTIDNPRGCGRQASCMGRSFSEKRGGPCRNDNPGNSRIIAE